MLLRLGLRASKAAALALEAEVTVHGKGRRAERLLQAGRPALRNATWPMIMLLIDRSISVL